MFQGNWVDLIIIVFLALYAWEGWERGFLVLLGEMGSLVVALVVALRFYPTAAKLLMDNFSLSLEFAKAVGFVFVTIGAEIVLSIVLGAIFARVPRGWFSQKWNKWLGILPAVVDGLILVGFGATVLVSLPVSGEVKQDVLGSKIGGVMVSQARVFENSLSDVFGGAIQQTLSFLTVNSGSRQSIDLHFRTSLLTVDTEAEQAMLVLVNQERTTRGLKALLVDGKLRGVARAHSQDMFTRGYFSHVTPEGKDPFQRMQEAGVGFQSAGENIAYAPSVSIAHEGLMNSPSHRENILSTDFGKVGVGVIDGGIYGKMFTEDFTN